jgi:hypothetical protein
MTPTGKRTVIRRSARSAAMSESAPYAMPHYAVSMTLEQYLTFHGALVPGRVSPGRENLMPPLPEGIKFGEQFGRSRHPSILA